VRAGFNVTTDWDDEKAESNLAKHDIAFEVAATVFLDPLAVTIFDPDHSEDEHRWITIGMAENEHVLLVVHTATELEPNMVAVRIISARKPTRRELRRYREGAT
jgi:uncharacterized DUF497 family protein